MSKIGVALAGGGPLGGIYEVGACVALEEAIDGLIESISREYEKQAGFPLTAYIAETGNGTESCS